MPAESKSQQRLFGMVHAYQSGAMKRAPKKIRDLSRRINPESVGHFAETSHEGLPEHTKKAFVEAFVQEVVDRGVAAEHVPGVVKRACMDPEVAAHFSDFLIKSSAGEGSRGPSGSSSAPPSSSSSPATPSARGLGHTPGVRRFMTGMAGMVQGITHKKPAIHPLDVKNTLAIAEVASRRRATLSPPPAPAPAQPVAPQPAQQPVAPPAAQPMPVSPMQAQAANPSPVVPTSTPYVPGMPKLAGASPGSPFQPSPAPKLNLKRQVNVTNPLPGIKPPTGVSAFRRNPATSVHSGPRAIRPAAPMGAV